MYYKYSRSVEERYGDVYVPTLVRLILTKSNALLLYLMTSTCLCVVTVQLMMKTSGDLAECKAAGTDINKCLSLFRKSCVGRVVVDFYRFCMNFKSSAFLSYRRHTRRQYQLIRTFNRFGYNDA